MLMHKIQGKHKPKQQLNTHLHLILMLTHKCKQYTVVLETDAQN